MRTRWLVAMGLAGLGLAAYLAWGWSHSPMPHWSVVIWDLIAIVGLAVGPWLVLTMRQLGGEPVARRALWWVVLHAGIIATSGIALGVLFLVIYRDADHLSAAVAGFSILFAGALGLFGGVLLPWIFVLTRTITRERAARVRAEGRAEMAAHLHDTVLQALTLIQKRTDEPAVLRLARATERELRAWLYGTPPRRGDDFAAAVKAVAEEVEDRFDVTVDQATVGTCRLDPPARAVVGALREALTNAAKHGRVRRVSVFAEVAETEVVAFVRDRGSGFDPTASNGKDRRGIADSIEGRIRQHGGTAAVRSAPGEGTEVELRIPLAGAS